MLRSEMLKKEFELDAELKMYQAAEDQSSVDFTMGKVFTNRCRLYGWRATYGDKMQRQNIKDLQKKIIDLEMKELKLRRFLGDYKTRVQTLENEIARGGAIPKPDYDSVQAAKENLNLLHERFQDAELELPRVEKDLKALRAELEKFEKTVKRHTLEDPVHISPSAELDSRAKSYCLERGVTYEDAADAIMAEDAFLSDMYTNYNPDHAMEAYNEN